MNYYQIEFCIDDIIICACGKFANNKKEVENWIKNVSLKDTFPDNIIFHNDFNTYKIRKINF